MTHPAPHLNEDDLAHYLRQTPDFFERYAEVLADVQLTSPISRRAVSLQERQAEMLRDRIRQLELRLSALTRHANDNLVLSDRLLRLACDILAHRDAHTLPAMLTEYLAEQFAVPQVALRCWDVPADSPLAAFAVGVSAQVRSDAMAMGAPYCGASTGLEAVQWLAQPEQASSVAMLPLRSATQAPVFGVLLLASPDPQRWTADMGTDLLSSLGQLVGCGLSGRCA